MPAPEIGALTVRVVLELFTQMVSGLDPLVIEPSEAALTGRLVLRLISKLSVPLRMMLPV